MGKVLHKLIRGVLPSWLLKHFFKSRASRNFSYLKIRQNNYKAAASPTLPSSSPTPAADFRKDGEESTYYYSYSDDDEQGNLSMQPGHGGDSTSSASLGRESRCRQYTGVYFQHDEHHDGHHIYLPHTAVDHDSSLDNCSSIHDNCSHQCMQAKGVQYDDCHSQHHDGKLDERTPRQNLTHHRGHKRKSLVHQNEDDGNDTPSCLMKRQKGGSVSAGYELPESISEVVGQGSVHVQYSYLQEPQLAFWDSMVDMIVSNELWDVNSQEALLLSYLTLNDPHLYSTICSSFLQALEDIHSFWVIS